MRKSDLPKLLMLATGYFVISVSGSGQEMENEALVDDVDPVELLKGARRSFQQSDFSAAERAFEQFFSSYGENPEAEEALRVHRPFLALAKLALGKYEEALPLIDYIFAEGQDDGWSVEFKLADELRFWRAVCLMQEEKLVAAQEAFGSYWSNERHDSFKRYESLLLFAHLYMRQGFHEVAAKFLLDQIPDMHERAPEAAGRGVLLCLQALRAVGDLDGSYNLVKQEYPRMENMTSLISFQRQLMGLGLSLLEEGEYRKAIYCLQRVWEKDRLLDHQARRLEDLRTRQSHLAIQTNHQSVAFQLGILARRIEQEIRWLENTESFTVNVRLRVAMAFQAQGRLREAALVIERMLHQEIQDPLLDPFIPIMVQNWVRIGRGSRAVEAADLFLEKTIDSSEAFPVVEILLLKAEALQKLKQPQAAAVTYGQLVEQFPEHDRAPSGLFLQAYMYLLQDDNEGALYHFDQLRTRYPDHALVEETDYWTGIAFSYSAEYTQARKAMEDYLARYGKKASAKYTAEAEFRIAYCAFALGDNTEALQLFRQFIVKNQEHSLIDEALLLLGDALMGEGKLDEGIAVYRKISPEAKRYYEDGWFKIGKALRLTDRLDEVQAHFQEYLTRHPESARMPEAVYWIGWVYRQHGEFSRAEEIYWRTLEEFGAHAELTAVEDLIGALIQMYRSRGEDGIGELLSRIERLGRQAGEKQRRLLALRCAWGEAQIARRRSQQAGSVYLLKMTPRLDARHDPVRISLDCADAQLAAGNLNVAGGLYESVRKWHPRAIERDRVFAGLGRIADLKQDVDAAIYWYEKCERYTASPKRLGETKVKRARLLAVKEKFEEAGRVLNAVLESGDQDSRVKAEALMEFGDLWMRQGQALKAAAYYERLYVAYGKYRKLVAQAYWKRGEALEKMSLTREAAEVYRELIACEDLQIFDETGKAQRRLKELKQAGEVSS